MKLKDCELEKLEEILTELNMDSADGYIYIFETKDRRDFLFYMIDRIQKHKLDQKNLENDGKN